MIVYENLILCANSSGTVRSFPRRNILPCQLGYKDHHWNTTLIRHYPFLMISSVFLRLLLTSGYSGKEGFASPCSWRMLRYFLKNPSGDSAERATTQKGGGRRSVAVYSPIPWKILTVGAGSWGRWADEKKFRFPWWIPLEHFSHFQSVEQLQFS